MTAPSEKEYYYECDSGFKGWKKATTDLAIRKMFRFYGGVKVWRVDRDGTKTLVHKQNNKGERLPIR